MRSMAIFMISVTMNDAATASEESRPAPAVSAVPEANQSESEPSERFLPLLSLESELSAEPDELIAIMRMRALDSRLIISRVVS